MEPNGKWPPLVHTQATDTVLRKTKTNPPKAKPKADFAHGGGFILVLILI
jgi:hypothetical protein